MLPSSAEAELLNYFHSGGELFKPEVEVLERVIRNILTSGGHVSNKSIILCLIRELEGTSDTAQLDILRRTLEMVVGRTPDDPEV